MVQKIGPVIDSRPGGLAGELIESLSHVSSTPCKSVLLLRDIVDAPPETVRRWQDEGVYSLIRTRYDSVVFLGEQSFFDALVKYRLQRYRGKVCHAGFLGNPRFDIVNSTLPPHTSKGRVLVSVGGGFDGSQIIQTVCDLLVDKTKNMAELAFTIVLGANCPLTSAEIRQHVKGADAYVEVLTYVSDLTCRIVEADLVISMCGYNTMFELIEAQKKIIAVPRDHSGYEQTLRACLLSDVYDGLWVIPQSELSSTRLALTMAAALEAPPPKARIPMNGAANLIAHLISIAPRQV